MKLLKLFAKKLKVYSDLDELPIHNWNKVMEKSDVTYLLKDEDLHGKPIRTETGFKLVEHWEVLYAEYVDKHLLTGKYKKKLRDQKRNIINKVKAYLSEDKSRRLISKAREFQFNNLYSVENVNFIETVALLQKRKIDVDIKKMSVNLFYTHIRLVNEEVKALKAQQQQKDGRNKG